MDRRKIVITGTSRGIGRYLAEHYATKGNTVFGCSRSRSSIENPNYFHQSLDINDEPAIKNWMFYLWRHAPVDVLINSAGIARMCPAMLTPTETVRELFDTNVISPFIIMRECAKLMRNSEFGGRVINISSVAVPLKIEGEAVYAASKAALEKLTEILAAELTSWKITLNTIGPNPIETNLIMGIPEEKIDKIIDDQPISRYGEMEDISNLTDFFIRQASDFVTGQTIYLGGIS